MIVRLKSFIKIIVFSLVFIPYMGHAKEEQSIHSASYQQRFEMLKRFRLHQPYSYKLPNGLKLLVYVKKDSPIVAHSIWYHVGSSDEQSGETGLAHFFEHLMFKGTKKHPEGIYSDFISSVGGYENAYTTSDYTVYYQNIPADSLKQVMAFEADRMVHLDIPKEAFYHERDVVLEERSMRIDNNPTSLLSEQMMASLYRNHPYGRPVIGWRHEIEGLEPVSAMRFYRQYYAPNNATVTIVGNVNPAEIYQAALETYGKNKKNPHLVRMQRPKEPKQNIQRTLVYQDKNVTLPMILLYAQGVGYGKNPKELYTLAIGLKALGDGSASYLYKKLINQEKIAVDLSVYTPTENQDAAPVMLYLVGNQTSNPQNMYERLDFYLQDAIHKRKINDEIAIAQQNLLSDFIYASDGRGNLARFFGVSLLNTGDFKDTIEFPTMIGNITADDVYHVLEKTFTPHNQVIGYLKPEKK